MDEYEKLAEKTDSWVCEIDAEIIGLKSSLTNPMK